MSLCTAGMLDDGPVSEVRQCSIACVCTVASTHCVCGDKATCFVYLCGACLCPLRTVDVCRPYVLLAYGQHVPTQHLNAACCATASIQLA